MSETAGLVGVMDTLPTLGTLLSMVTVAEDTAVLEPVPSLATTAHATSSPRENTALVSVSVVAATVEPSTVQL